MKIVVALIVYNRLENLRKWLECWKHCEKPHHAELRVIHNCDGLSTDSLYKQACIEYGVTYVSRKNVGLDIGAFQDVCKTRLTGFESDWTHLFWVADDTIPTTRAFVSVFANEAIKFNVGAVCLEVSTEFKRHIRTTGFMITKEVATKLQFPVPTITSKAHCYLFEHRSPAAFYEQVIKMGRRVITISRSLGDAPLWDTHHRSHLGRWNEVYKAFPTIAPVRNNKVTIIAPIFNTFPEIVSSLINQTHKNWELLLIHDGPPLSDHLEKVLEAIDDPRIHFIVRPIRQEKWGHPIRQWALEEIKNDRLRAGDFIIITNPDNYYVPVALEYLLQGVRASTVGVFSDKFVHAYDSHQFVDGRDVVHKWGIINAKLELGYIDCGGMMVTKEAACSVGWPSLEIYSDWTYFKALIDKYGKGNFTKVNGCLFVHN